LKLIKLLLFIREILLHPQGRNGLPRNRTGVPNLLLAVGLANSARRYLPNLLNGPLPSFSASQDARQ